MFLRLAQFDNAVVYESQWMRAFTASLVDFGLVHAALVNAAFLTIAAEAEALLGTRPFLTVYVLSAAAGGIGSLAMEPSTLHVTSSDGLFGVFGALLLYSALNVETNGTIAASPCVCCTAPSSRSGFNTWPASRPRTDYTS